MVKKINKLSLSSQLLFLVLIVLVLPFVILGYILFNNISTDLQDLEKERALSSSQAAHNLVNNIGNQMLSTMKPNCLWEENRVAVKNRDAAWLEDNVNYIKDVIPTIHFISTIDFKGQVISQTGDVNEFTGKVAFPIIVNNLKTKNEFSGLVNTSKGPAIITVSKISNEEGTAEPTGALIFGRFLNLELLKDVKGTLDEELAFVTKDGYKISTMANLNEQRLKEYLTNGQGVNIEITQNAGNHFTQAYSKVKDLNGQIIGALYVGHPSKSLTQVMANLEEFTVEAIIVIAIIILILVFLLHNKIIKPLSHLACILQKVATGSLHKVVSEQYVKRKDEIGVIAISIKNLIESWRGIVANIQKISQQLNQSSDEVVIQSNTSEQEVQSIVEITKRIAGDAEVTKERIRTALDAIRSLETSSRQIAADAEISRANAIETQTTAVKGEELLAESIISINQVAEASIGLKNLINTLNSRMGEIGSMVNKVEQIANQTNLLALNASIEAARAGDQGRGFSVVAQEVRKLAEETNDSTNEMNNVVDSIYGDTHKSISAINNEILEVEEAVKAVSEINQFFITIVDKMKVTANQVEIINGFVEQQLINSGDATKQMEELFSEAGKMVIEFEKSVDKVQAILNSLSKIAEVSERNLEISKYLNKTVSQFTVE